VGGQVVTLRTLSIEESEKWQDRLAGLASNFDLPDRADPDAFLKAIARQPTSVMLELVQAYDVDGLLPSDLRRRLTQVELYAAVKQMTRAELPFLEDARSMVEAFGPQLRAMIASVLFSLYGQASSTSGPSPIGDSTPASSDADSRTSGSSSSGATPSNGHAARPRNRASRRSTPSSTAN
jgi:hypothetical protein